MKNKGKEILNPKVQLDKSKKLSGLWDCFECGSRSSHLYCEYTNSSLFVDENDLEEGQVQNMVDEKRSFSPWEGTSSFFPPK